MKRLLLALTLPTLLALLSLVTLVGAQAPATATKVYLPLVACPGCAGNSVLPNPTPAPVDANAHEARIIQLVNEARVAVGCPAAIPNAVLMQATGDWSAYMAATSDYRHAPGNWYNTYGYPSGLVLENIGGSGYPDYMFEGWMLSSLHKRNIEWCLYHLDDPLYNPAVRYEIGIGYAGGYWTLAIGTN